MSAPPDERPNIIVNEEMLLGFADGRLDAAQNAAVEAYLAAHPDRATDVAIWQRQNAALTTLFGPIAGEPIPARLNPHRLSAQATAQRWDWTKIAAGIVLLVGVSAGTGWYLRTATWQEEPASDRLIEGAVAAHSLYVKETAHAVEVTADDKAHLVTWLSNRLGRQIDTPDLTKQGFSLVGGRLLPPLAETGTGPAAQFMYQNQTADRLTVYITAAANPPGKPFELYNDDGVEGYYWANTQITCTVIGDLPHAEMQAVAKDVYQQLTWRPDPPARS